MTLQQCKYVLEIVKFGSFNAAANQLFVAQSSLSSAVKLLENELNIMIFNRTKSGVVLTADGAEFVRYAEQIVERGDFIIQRYQLDQKKDRLYISTQHYDFVADIFCKLVNEIEEDFDFALREIHTYEVIREVETAYSDIGIIAIKDEHYELMNRHLEQKELQFVEFVKTYPHVFVRKGHALSQKSTVKTTDVMPYPYVFYEQGVHNSDFFTEELFTNNHAGQRIEISDRATLMNVLLTTNCYTVGTGIMPSALNQEKILSLPLECDTYYHIGYIIRKNLTISPLVARFIQHLKALSEERS